MKKDVHKLALKIEKDFIQQLKKERKRQGLSYAELAERSGLHRTAISLIERGERHPTLLVCIKLAQCLKLEELFK